MSPLLRVPLRCFNLHPLWQRLPVRVWGSRLRAPTADRWLALMLHRWHWMGVQDHRFLSAQVRPGMTVVDVGANQGLYSLLFARLVGPGGRVLAFEPDDMLHEALRKNIEANQADAVQPHHIALGSQPGTMTLHRSLLNSGDNRLTEKARVAGPREAVTIRVDRLDRLLTDQPVDFIKMDVQGWEMEVFRGMTGLLDGPRSTRLAIYFEFWPQGLRDAGTEPVALLNFLVQRGFWLSPTHGNGAGTKILDLAAFAHGLSGGQYTNLFAERGSSSPLQV